VLEVAAEHVGGPQACRPQAIPLRWRLLADRGAGLARELGDGPLERRLVVQPMMRVEVRRRPADELACQLVLRAVLD